MRIIYSKDRLTKEFKELFPSLLPDDDYAFDELNCDLSYLHPSFPPDYSSICTERPLISYYPAITISDMELDNSDPHCIALNIANCILTMILTSVMTSYIKPMELSDLCSLKNFVSIHYDGLTRILYYW